MPEVREREFEGGAGLARGTSSGDTLDKMLRAAVDDIAALRQNQALIVADLAELRTQLAATVLDATELRNELASTVADVAELRSQLIGLLQKLDADHSSQNLVVLLSDLNEDYEQQLTPASQQGSTPAAQQGSTPAAQQSTQPQSQTFVKG